MINIGITGQQGFIGTHLYNTLKLYSEKYSLIEFKNEYFEKIEDLDNFVRKCDVIVHLAALNRHESSSVIYDTNIRLVSTLINSFERTKSTPHVIISSSSQEQENNLYGKSKKISRLLLSDWAKENNALFTGMIIPNVYGPFCKPNYNSVVATFCYKLSNNQKPKIDIDKRLKLIFVSSLVKCILNCIDKNINKSIYKVKPCHEIKVSNLLELIKNYKKTYINEGKIPEFKNSFELNLFNTFRSYFNYANYFPKKYKEHNDERGSFVELIKLGTGGQVSFSTTNPGFTRGNHFHTRKIERFSVIKGKALIQLRRVGTNEVLDFYLDGNEPSYVDMPIWYTHNIKNIGEDILYTSFWINEIYSSEDPDTFFEQV